MTKLLSYLECIESAQEALESGNGIMALAYIELGREATKNGAWRDFVNGRPGNEERA
jgi:hypothetical protein